MNEFVEGITLDEGKTKIILEVTGSPELIRVRNKPDITKFDDEKQTKQMESKPIYATTTTCCVFELLKQAGIPVAYKKQISETDFLAPKCKMIPLEVIIRRYAVGSYLDRNPHLRKSADKIPHRFHRLVFELFLKTTKGKVEDFYSRLCEQIPDDPKTGRPVDDPYIANPYGNMWELRHPKYPLWQKESIFTETPLIFPQNYFLPAGVTVADIEKIARQVFLVLESAWSLVRCRLIDFKIEFGITTDGKLVVADVIDNDSWRLRDWLWKELSKQLFRDNADMSFITDKYALVANLVQNFRIPEQAVVFWRGSEGDALPAAPIIPGVNIINIVKSGHKAPATCLEILEDILSKYPEGGVIIPVVGMSDGLAPVIAARISWPVIAVPATAKERPHDVWSSLEMPSNVPLLTVLNPDNAVKAALNILAQKNPAAYMARQYALEELDI